MLVQTSTFVSRFDGRLGSNVRCCPYHKLVPVSNGCPYYCTYCYLASVYRKFAPFIKVSINYDAMFRQIRRAMGATAGRTSFNMGEVLDSLALDNITNLTTMFVPFFAGFSRGFLMRLTKSSNIDNLVAVEPTGQTVVSWSLNSQEMIEHIETGTASLTERIEAGKECQQHGYRVRIRIDPGILYPDWRAGYAALIKQALTVIEPENITLGMLRVLPGRRRLAIAAYGESAGGLFGEDLVSGASDGKVRYAPRQRIEFYSFLLETIRSFDQEVSISLCRETPEIWSMFEGLCKPGKCNCVI